MGLVDIINSFPDSATHKEVAAAVREYAIGKSADEIRSELSFKISRFKQTLSKKIHSYGIEFLLFQLATGITAQEQITTKRKEGVLGYPSLSGLTSCLTGITYKQVKIKKYLIELSQKNGLPLLTQEHQEYIDNFTINYIKDAKTTREKLHREIAINQAFSFNPEKTQYSLFLDELSRKISQDAELQFELFKKWTGITSQEQITTKSWGNVLGLETTTGLATFFTRKRKTTKGKGDFFRKLAKEHNMPLLTQEHQGYIVNFSVEYIKQTQRDKLLDEIMIGRSVSLDPNKKTYSPFLHELSRKISQDDELQFELFKKLTGITSQEQITAKGVGGLQGYTSLVFMASLLTGDIIGFKRTREYFLSLLGEHPEKDDEYYELRNALTELRRNNKDNGAIKPIGNNPFSGFGKCFEHYVGILLALENNAVEHQYKMETKGSFRLVDFYMGDKGYVSVEELGELVEVKSGVNITPHDKAQLKDFLAQHNGVAYIVYDAESPLIKALKQIADEEGKNITILPYTALSSIAAINEADISKLFSDKEQFKEGIRTKDKKQLETDLFSAYLWVRETGGKEGLISVLNAAYNQNQEEKDSVRDAHNINWLSINEYQRQALEVFSKEKGRHFDLELAKKKLRSKILALKKDIVVNNEEHEQEIRLIEKTDGKYDIQEFYIRDKLLGTARWLKNGDVEAIF